MPNEEKKGITQENFKLIYEIKSSATGEYSSKEHVSCRRGKHCEPETEDINYEVKTII